MDLRRAFTYLFADPQWIAKLAIATLLAPPSLLASIATVSSSGR
jgi:hypothetical protein